MEKSQVATNFKSWAIVELMGHQQAAGFASEENIAGVNMLRVDVPEVKKVGSTYREGEYVKVEKTIPAYSRYFGGGAIHSITPCTEEIARSAAARYGAEPPVTLALPERLLPASKETSGESNRNLVGCGRCMEDPCVCGGPDLSDPNESDEA